MGLTRVRAEQISDIDYKQATRVVTVSNITLAGGAPAMVDGVTLLRGNRVLVTGQSTASQNGLYQVQTVGTGSNGTWIRSSDGNATGEIEAGMIVMVTEGTIYADTQWKLITDDPIVIGVTALTFVQNYSTNSLVSGNSNVIVNESGNVTVSSAGVANVLTVTSTGILVSGNITSSGATINGDLTVTGNATLSGNIVGDRITNGNTSIEIQTTNGNANVSVGGISNVVVFTTAGINVTGAISATGNLTAGNIITSGSGDISGNGNILVGGQISATGNITGNYIIGDGSLLTNVSGTGGSSIANGTSNISIPVASGNITMSRGGLADSVIVGQQTVTIKGPMATFKNITSNVSIENDVNAALFGTTTIANGVSFFIPDSSTVYLYD